MTEELSNFMQSDWKGFIHYRSINVDREKRETLETNEDVKSVDYQHCLGDLLQIEDKCSISDRCLKILQPKIAHQADISYQAMVLTMIELVGRCCCRDRK